MSKIPFKKQRLAVDPIQRIQHNIQVGDAVSGDELLRAIELSEGHQLDTRLRGLLPKFSVAAAKRRRGRPRNCKGREDFALGELDGRYPAVLQKYQGEAQQRRRLAAEKGAVLPRAERTPSESAYRELLRKMKADFPNTDWLALRNKHSAWNSGYYDPPENHVDSEDVYAEIDRQFPKPRNHK
jgi:hypothetical protein